MVETKARGLSNELLCQAYITSLGYNISVPLGEDCRYDFIMDIKGILKRVQVKSCVENENGLSFSTKSITTSGKENIVHLYSKEEIDFISIYYEHQCYLIPIELFEGQRQCSLSFTGKKVNINQPLFIEDFKAEIIIDAILNNKSYKKGDNDFIVYQYDLQDNLIASFSSYADAGKSLGKSSSHISSCARGLRKTAYGYKWALSLKE